MMRRRLFVLFLMLVIFLPCQVNALSVSKKNVTIDKGSNQNVELSAVVEEEIVKINFSLVYTSYDVPAYFIIGSGLTESVNGIKHSISFSEGMTGNVKLGNIKVSVVDNPKVVSGTVNIHSATALTSDGETINLDTQMINVTVGGNNNTPTVTAPKDDDKETKDNLLSKIESNIVNIELKKDVFEYTVNVKENVEELDLNPILVDDKYEVEISSQKISELEDSKIVIKVKNGNVVEEYKILVNVIEEVKTEVDKSEFKNDYSYKGKWLFLVIVFGVILFAGLLLLKKDK